MKKLFFGLMVLFVVGAVFAISDNSKGDKIDAATAMVVANTSKNFQEAFERKIAEAKLEREKNNSGLRLGQLNKTEKGALKDALKDLSAERKELKQAENQVRDAVHSLIASRNWSSPGIGQKVAEIARQFNSSNQKAINAEFNVERRNVVMRFLFGSDVKDVSELENSVNASRERLKELGQLRLNMTAEDAKDVDSRIGELENETARLDKVASEQKAKRGILGWLFRR